MQLNYGCCSCSCEDIKLFESDVTGRKELHAVNLRRFTNDMHSQACSH